MKAIQIKELLCADVLCGQDNLENEIISACGSDLMSDVLAYVKDRTVLLTGLTNSHVVKTAELLDVSLIVFVRGKMPSEDILKMAVEKGIVMLRSTHTLYDACGILYSAGLRGGSRRNEQ